MDHWWHDTDKKTEVLRENPIPITLSIIKLPRTGPGSIQALHSKWFANDCLSYDIASLKPEIHHNSQQIHFLSITKTNSLMMLREITAIFYGHCMKHIAGVFPLYASTSVPATLSTNVRMTHAVNHHQEILVEDLDLGILKTRTQETHSFFWAEMGGDTWLDGSLEFEPIVAKLHAEVMQLWAQTFVKPLCLNRSASHTLSLHYTLTFTLQMKKSHGETSVSADKKFPAEQHWAWFIVLTWPLVYRQPQLACWPRSTLVCASDDLGQPSVSSSISWIAKVRGSSCQSTLSRTHWPGVWCGQWGMDLPHSLQFACNFTTHCGLTLRLTAIHTMDTA